VEGGTGEGGQGCGQDQGGGRQAGQGEPACQVPS
jgi:hypothetical protein